MMISERIQNLIHKADSSLVVRLLWTLVAILTLGAMTAWYDVWAYRGFSAPEAMEAAQVARNLAGGHGFTTQSIEPFDLYLFQNRYHATMLEQVDFLNKGGFYPDLANAPLYPAMLAGLMKLRTPQWDAQAQKKFWWQSGHYQRYQPEFMIALFNQALLLVAVVLTFFIARKLFDPQVAWASAVFTLGSDLLWKFSVSGLSSMLLLVIFLGLVLCLIKIESLARAELPDQRFLFGFTVAAGLLMGLGMLTRYSFGWLIVPVAVFLGLFGGARRMGLLVAVCLVFVAVVTPWLARNYYVSHTPFGTAGYAAIEGTPEYFPGMSLLQSSSPRLAPEKAGGWSIPLVQKMVRNAFDVFENQLPRLGGWAAVLFFAGFLLGFRNPASRRLRYFTLMCLGVLILAQAMGRTWLSDSTPELNSENLLVLLTPLALVFGTAFFLTLLDQMNLPALELRPLAVVLLGVVLWLPFISSFLPPKPSPTTYPPYYPPEVQKICGWMQPDELLMSDMPWAVAWYGQHACIQLSLDAHDDFNNFNDDFHTVKGVYITTLTLDDKFLSNVARADKKTWGHFVLDVASKSRFPDDFPLQKPKVLISGLFFTDHQRWPDAK